MSLDAWLLGMTQAEVQAAVQAGLEAQGYTPARAEAMDEVATEDKQNAAAAALDSLAAAVDGLSNPIEVSSEGESISSEDLG